MDELSQEALASLASIVISPTTELLPSVSTKLREFGLLDENSKPTSKGVNLIVTLAMRSALPDEDAETSLENTEDELYAILPAHVRYDILFKTYSVPLKDAVQAASRLTGIEAVEILKDLSKPDADGRTGPQESEEAQKVLFESVIGALPVRELVDMSSWVGPNHALDPSTRVSEVFGWYETNPRFSHNLSLATDVACDDQEVTEPETFEEELARKVDALEVLTTALDLDESLLRWAGSHIVFMRTTGTVAWLPRVVTQMVNENTENLSAGLNRHEVFQLVFEEMTRLKLGDDSVLQAYVKKKNGGAAVLYPSDENAGMTTDSVLKTIRQEYDNALDAAKRREYDKLPAVTSI